MEITVKTKELRLGVEFGTGRCVQINYWYRMGNNRYMILCVTPVLINNLKHKEAFFATEKNIWCDTQGFKFKLPSKVVEN